MEFGLLQMYSDCKMIIFSKLQVFLNIKLMVIDVQHLHYQEYDISYRVFIVSILQQLFHSF